MQGNSVDNPVISHVESGITPAHPVDKGNEAGE